MQNAKCKMQNAELRIKSLKQNQSIFHVPYSIFHKKTSYEESSKKSKKTKKI